jgi:hypothetical protein
MAADRWGFEPFDTEAHIDDVEVALMEYLDPAGRTVTQLMSWEPGDLPAIRIQRIGGGRGETADLPRVLIQCYAYARSVDTPRWSRRVAADVERRMDAIAGVWIDGTVLESATKDSGPVTRPWDDPSIRVTELIYSVIVRN